MQKIFRLPHLRLLLLGVVFTACQKESDVLEAVRSASTGQDALAVFAAVNGAPAQLFTFGTTPYTCITTQGTQITIPANAFVLPSGLQPGSAAVQLEVREVFDKATMLLSAIPTVSNTQPLETGAIFYLKATQGGTRLRLNPAAALSIRTSSGRQEPVFPNAQLFYGRRTGGVFTWQPQSANDTRSAVRRDSLPGQSPFYQITLNNDTLSWVSCAYVIPTASGATVQVSVTAADVQVSNTAVFLVLKGRNSTLRGTQQITGEFTFPHVPVGADATVVVVRNVDGAYYYGQQTLPITATSYHFAPPLTPMSEAAVVAAIKRL